ncbi:MAG: HD domain-containing phosphohydrolase [Elusimicrobiota bacterium]
MDSIRAYSSLYRLIGSDKQGNDFFKEVARTLVESIPKTEWNIIPLVESTAQLEFPPEMKVLENICEKSREVFENGKRVLLKKDLPSGYKWGFISPLVNMRQKKGVVVCLGKGKKEAIADTVSDDIAFVIQQYQLRQKLIRDTMMMNTVVMASQSTASSTEVFPIIKILRSYLKKYLAAEAVRIMLWDRTGSFYYGDDGSRIDIEVPEGESITQEVRSTGRPLMLQNAYEYETFNAQIDAITDNDKVLNMIAAPIAVASGITGVLIAVNNDKNRVFVGSELVWVKSVCGEIGATIEKIKLYGDINKLFLSSVEALAAAIEGKDPYTHGHSRRVTMFSMVIGKKLGLDKKDIEDIRLSALLHDVGKIAVTESILMKESKLTDDEWYVMKQHPAKGVAMLEPVKEFKRLLPGIRHHHERYDGTGYPDGKAGEDIPLIARIIAVADAFDAMTSKRIYRDAMAEEKALKEIERCRGKQFDPEIADIFIDVYREKFYAGDTA